MTIDRREYAKPPFFPPEPELKYGGMPVWHHHHSIKMDLAKQEHAVGRGVLIRGSAAMVGITERQHPTLERSWDINWEVIRTHGIDEVHGKLNFSDEDLARAFGLDENPGEDGTAILTNHGGTTAHQGYYIRYKDFLNIPGPGTGHDGDPNVSVHLTPEIKEAVRALLESK